MSDMRVAVFDDFMPIKYNSRQPDILVDEPSDWAMFLGNLEFSDPFECQQRAQSHRSLD